MNAIALTRNLRRLMKLLHTLGAAGFMGGMAALLAVMILAPASGGGVQVVLIGGLAKIAAWVVGPSMILVVTSGLLAMLLNPAFYDIGWVWAKAATGILVLEGGLHVMGPIQEEAKRGAAALAHGGGAASLRALADAEGNTIWVLLAVAGANIVLAIWRPRFIDL